MKYNWQLPDWPKSTYDINGLEEMLLQFATEASYVNGLLQAMPDALQMEAAIGAMMAEALTTSAIEGEHLSRQDVYSSIRNNLGLNDVTEIIKDKKAQGAATLMVLVRESFAEPLTDDVLFEWHRTLMAAA